MMKEKAAKWFESYWSLVVAAIALGLIAINDSWIGLILYFAVIHLLFVAYVVGLFDSGFFGEDEIKKIAEENKTKIKDWTTLTIFIALCVVSIVILAARGHWYLLAITIATAVFFSIHILDGLRKVKKYKERRTDNDKGESRSVA